MQCVIYARFSSDRQTEMSIEAQVRACTEYAEKYHINIIRTYADEAISGTTNKRPAYQEMLSDAFEGKFDLILIHKYDRIARDLAEQVNLESRLKSLNIRLIAVAQDYGEGKDANLTKGIQWVLGEYYSANLSEEVRKGHREIALKGLHNGGYPPFGYDIIGQRYVINEIEAKYVKLMYKNCILGGTYQNIIRAMAEAGITGKRGKPIGYPQINEILHNEKYTGVYIYSLHEEPDRSNRRSKPNAIRVESAIPAIISKEDYVRAQATLAERSRCKTQKHRCSGLVYCGKCGAKMHLSRTKRKTYEYNNFRCCEKCGAKGVPIDFVDEAVDAYLEQLFSPENKLAIANCLKDLDKYNKESSKALNKEIEKRKEGLNSEISNIMKAMASGAFENNYDVCNSLLTAKREELRALDGMRSETVKPDKVKDWLTEIVSQNFTPGIFIDRIIATNDSIEIVSNFDRVVCNNGCGGTIDCFPTTLKGSKYNRR